MSEPALNIDNDGKIVGKRGAKAYKKWIPKEWRPEYEAIVALSCTGLSNKDVGKRFGYGPQQVSNIVNTPQAKRLREIIVARLREANATSFEERFAALGEEALKNIEAVLSDANVLEKAPLQIFDRSLAFLKAIGKTKDGTIIPPSVNAPLIGTARDVRVLVMSNDAAKILDEATAKADKVKEIHSGPIKVVDAESK